MMLPLVSMDNMVCLNIFLAIVFDTLFAKCILAPDSAIGRLVLKGAKLYCESKV